MLVALAGTVLFVSMRVARELPADLSAVASAGSAETSVLRDREGRVLERFHLVESLGPRAVVSEVFVDAFLAAASPAFYESRTDDAIPLARALLFAWRRELPTASPLSAELAALLLASERPGLVRRAREAILAARLDARTPLSVRVTAWLERQPLCWGRRGLREAAQRCIVVPEKDRAELEVGTSPGEAAVLAVAAAAGMDLVEDPALLQARRDGALQRLVAREWIEGEQVAAALRVRARRPETPGPLVYAEEVVSQIRHTFDAFDPLVLDVKTPLVAGLQRAADEDEGLRGGSWVVLDARTGDVAAAGGDIWSGLDAPTVRELVGIPLPSRLTALGLAEALTALASDGQWRSARWFGAINVLGSADDVLAPTPRVQSAPLLPTTEAAVLRGRWPMEGDVAVHRADGLILALVRDHVLVLRAGPGEAEAPDLGVLMAQLPAGAVASTDTVNSARRLGASSSTDPTPTTGLSSP